VLNDGTVKLVDDPRDLVADVFADPQRLNPGNISIIRSIVTPSPQPPPDCGAVQPLNCDTAVFAFDRLEYDIVLNANGTVTVTHVPSRAAVVRLDEGSDTLRNIEQLQFADVLIPVPKRQNTVPGVVGLTQAAATTAILQAGLRVGVVTSVNSATIGIGKVVSADPRAGTTLPPNSPVDLVISLGTITPLVVGVPLGDAGIRNSAVDLILGAGMVVGTVTQQSSNTVPVGVVISQNPADGLTVDVGTAMNLVVSSGRPPVAVPNVVGQTQAAATASLTGAGFTVSVTTAASTTVPAGTVISQTPTGGTLAASGSAVAIVVSLGTAPTIATTVTRNNTNQNTTNTSPAFAVGANTLVVALISTDAPAAGANTIVNSMNNSGTLLTWTRATRAAVQRGDAEVWWAFVPTARASMTVTAALSQSVPSSMTVVGFTGAANSMVGAASAIANKATGVAGDPTATITTTRANSWVFGVGVDWDLNHVLTAGPGTTIINQFVPSSLDTYWSVRSTAPQVLAGVPVTLSVTGTGTDRWNFAVIEIRQP
jgi:beta-lactam-binding protein with PASTA domain